MYNGLYKEDVYDADHTLGHREYWRMIFAEVREEKQSDPEPEENPFV